MLEATIRHKNSETNSTPLIINVVCKYLRQFVGASFSVATLPICCNIEQGERDLIYICKVDDKIGNGSSSKSQRVVQNSNFFECIERQNRGLILVFS